MSDDRLNIQIADKALLVLINLVKKEISELSSLLPKASDEDEASDIGNDLMHLEVILSTLDKSRVERMRVLK